MSPLVRLHGTRLNVRSLPRWFTPFKAERHHAPVLEARGNRPLQMTFEDQLKILTYYHLEEHSSGRHLLQILAQEDFATTHIVPPCDIQKSAFFEALNSQKGYWAEKSGANLQGAIPVSRTRLNIALEKKKPAT